MNLKPSTRSKKPAPVLLDGSTLPPFRVANKKSKSKVPIQKFPVRKLPVQQLNTNSPVLRTVVLPSPSLLNPLTPLRNARYSVSKTPDSTGSTLVSSTPLFFDNRTDTIPPAYLNIYYNNDSLDWAEESGFLSTNMSESQKAMAAQNKDDLVRTLESDYVAQGGVLSAEKEAAALAARHTAEKLALEEKAQMAAEGLSKGAISKTKGKAPMPPNPPPPLTPTIFDQQAGYLSGVSTPGRSTPGMPLYPSLVNLAASMREQTMSAPPNMWGGGFLPFDPPPYSWNTAGVPPANLTVGSVNRGGGISDTVANLASSTDTIFKTIESQAVTKQRQEVRSRIFASEQQTIKAGLEKERQRNRERKKKLKEERIAALRERLTRVEQESTDGETGGESDKDDNPPVRRTRPYVMGEGEPLYQPHTTENSDEAKGLYVPFLHLSKAMNTLNDPAERDKPANILHTRQHIDSVKESTVEKALEESLNSHIESLEQAMAQQMGIQTVRILDMQEQMNLQLADRVTRVELNEKLSSRALSEKKDAIVPYNVHTVEDCTEEAFRKATQYLNNIVKTIAMTTTYSSAPYNYIAQVAAESNKCVAIHQMSESQHMKLIFSFLPSNADERFYLGLARDLADLFSTISTMAPQIMTRADLEKKINNWKLSNASLSDMSKSLVELSTLINKNHDEYPTPMLPAVLHRAMISRILQQNDLPYAVRTSLTEARLRIRDTDTLSEANTALDSACKKFLGARIPRSKLVKTDEKTNKNANAIKYPPPKYHLAGTLGTDHDVLEQKKPGANKQGQGRTEGKDSGKGKIDGVQQKKSNFKQDGKSPYTQQNDRGNRQFVKPWNPNIPHTSKSGNQLTKDFEEWMKGFCHRCGYGNHAAKDCRTYPSRTTVLTLCQVCNQGLHVDCLSKRKDILERKKLEGQNELMKNEVTATVKKMFNIYSLNQKAQQMINHAPKVTKRAAPPVVEQPEDDEDVWESD